jgi:hypothetical protein
MIEDAMPERPLDRRFLLRGGAVLAGAAGVSVVGAALSATSAEAADGQFMVVGQPNASTSTTAMTVGGSTGSPNTATMTLTNASGPSLRLMPTGPGYEGGLDLGEIASTDLGPEIGVDYGAGTVTSWLATGLDLDEIPVPMAITPQRVLDTRTSGGRSGIRTTSPNALDSSFRLKAGAWIDVALAASSPQRLDAAFLNVTAVLPDSTGFLVVYPPGVRPASSTLNFQKAQIIANGAFVLTGIADEDPDWYVVRIFSAVATHVVMDLTGVTLRGVAGGGTTSPTLSAQQSQNRTSRMKRMFHFR